ncbi:CesT family type III secretion system chaperone [Polaribacter porphyrae]|uniref:Molecular chaperone Tir n=1 Tax=Polaribacter porphyrae TaxID=1137780 RepID=A0A2S7WTQ0_9FLAO|nr:CesT family type III secretion system chaperone [Polaribacter porphyrae]PQJ80701.1 molecular chaperone Tir [Polaribacter porphyrae]
MKNHNKKIKNYLMELDFNIVYESVKDGVLMISKETEGIKNLILGIAPPILIMEQHIFNIKNRNEEVFKKLLQKNRDIIHGAFVLDETGQKVIFRDTLQIENLDLNELEASLNSLSLLLSEYSEQIINFSKY